MFGVTFYDNLDDPPHCNESETFGPFADLQMVYRALQVDGGRTLAVCDKRTGVWWVSDSTGTRRFTDFVISEED